MKAGRIKLSHRGFALMAWAVFAGLVGDAWAQDPMQSGKELFTRTATPACAVCHTLVHAGASGAIGPSLDELKPDAQRVAKAVRNGIGQMPPFPTLSDAQVKLLAQYVARVSGADH